MKNMKMKTLMIVALASMMSATVSAQMSLGDTAVINFTESGNTVGGNWNDFVTTLDEPFDEGILIPNLVRFSDGEETGVSLSLFGTENSFGLGGRDETPVSSRSFPVTGTIPDAAQRRLTYHTANNNQFVFDGLDDNLTYNLSILSANTGGRNVHNWIANPGSNQVSIAVDPDDGLVHTFSNLSTNGSGSIILQSSTTGGGIDGQHLNAMELTAIPEPGTLALIGIALGRLLLFRRKK